MLYTMLLSWKAGLDRQRMDEALARRSRWEYPRGAQVVGEYWLGTHSPAVVAVFEASDFSPILEMEMTWNDLFDIVVVPTTTPEEGLRLGSEILQRRPA
ncbi:MAG TPA: DUF3303 family protein [Dehalococcoidia bacterium]|nr:DUF3303 family protein [Dehalococcoidia bacterium]